MEGILLHGLDYILYNLKILGLLALVLIVIIIIRNYQRDKSDAMHAMLVITVAWMSFTLGAILLSILIDYNTKPLGQGKYESELIAIKEIKKVDQKVDGKYNKYIYKLDNGFN